VLGPLAQATRLHLFLAGAMHLLYLDDAGSAGNQDEDYLVLAGLSVYEAQAYWFTERLDRLAESINPKDPHSIEFHASSIFAGKEEPWKDMARSERQGVIKAVLGILAESYESAKAFGRAIHKKSYPGVDFMEVAFEDLCNRFDIYLSRLKQSGDRQRGLLILDRSAKETSLQRLARDFRVVGTQWGVLRNLADTPLFVDSVASRLVQMADHVAYALFRRYNANDIQYFNIVGTRFHEVDGVIHGLSHKQTLNPNCMCPACMSRRLAKPATESE